MGLALRAGTRALAHALNSARGAFASDRDVVDDQVVVGHQVPLGGVIPEGALICNQVSLVVDHRVVAREHVVLPVAGGRVVLEPGQASFIARLWIPRRFSAKAVATGLFGRHGTLTVDATHRRARGSEESRQVFGKVLTCGRVGE
ncbi:hypothetical protein [Chloroflexus sp.]|uniref:hypothetical protein n=1 Tax=Chloroflexus sp. TaxID=1904827 RepID=UPI00404A4844